MAKSTTTRDKSTTVDTTFVTNKTARNTYYIEETNPPGGSQLV